MKTKLFILIWLQVNVALVQAQEFGNLDFEAAKIISILGSPIFPYEIAKTNAVPGWLVFGSTQGNMSYNNPALGSTWVDLEATNGIQISGNFSVLLQGGLSQTSATISQTGLVPAWAQTLVFAARPIGATLFTGGILQVSLAGQNLSFSQLSAEANYTLYGADISLFAGQTQELAFSALRNLNGPNNWILDNIQFSTVAVPEPGVWSLLGLSGLVVGGWRGRLARLSKLGVRGGKC